MNRIFLLVTSAFSLLVLCTGCREQYLPEIRPELTRLLVVEGIINGSSEQTSIRLSRTMKLADSVTHQPEAGAEVLVEDDGTGRYSLRESDPGLYAANGLNLQPGKKYRLRIRAGSREYLSEFVTLKKTPLIDSVSWERTAEGIQISVSTHDPANNSRYYLWDYEETWEIHSRYNSSYVYVNGFIAPRNPQEARQLFFCWQTAPSTRIVLGSSTSLRDDVIHKAPVLQIRNGDERGLVRYSLLLKQYAVSREAYEFFQLMRKNTESLGSIFDPQPSDITGNIRCVSNPGEKVVGYVLAATAEEKRIFISEDELPGWKDQRQCEEIYVVNNPDSLRAYFGSMGYIPSYMKGFFEGYYGSTSYCMDCRKKGSPVRPSFW